MQACIARAETLSVRLPVRHALVGLLYQLKKLASYDFFTNGEPEHSFCKYPVYPEILKGSPRARALNETGIGRPTHAHFVLLVNIIRNRLVD